MFDVFLFDEVGVYIHEKISSHNDGNYKLKKTSGNEAYKRSSCCSQCMFMMFAGIFLSEIRSYEWSGNQSDKSEWSYYDAEKRKHDNRDDKSDIASTDSSFSSAEFFRSSWWYDVIEYSEKNNDQCPDDEKRPAERMSWSQL